MSEVTIKSLFEPREWQTQVMSDMREHAKTVLRNTGSPHAYFAVLAARQSGKTHLAVNLAINAIIDAGAKRAAGLWPRDQKPLAVYFAPLLRQARDIAVPLFEYYLQPLKDHGLVRFNKQELKWELEGLGAIQLLSSTDYAAARGLGIDFMVVDEIADAPMEFWAAVEPTQSARPEPWSFFIGTPSGKGFDRLAEFFARGQRDDGSFPAWWSDKYDVHRVGVLSPAEIENRRRNSLSQEVFEREYLCRVDTSGPDTFIGYELVEAAMRRDPGYMRPRGERVLGVDIARHGNDYCVIQPRIGLHMFKPILWQSDDLMASAAKVADTARCFDPDAIFIDIGMGAGVSDRLNQIGIDNTLVNFGSSSPDPSYFNMRAYMYGRLRDALKRGATLPDDDRYLVALPATQYSFSANSNKLQLEPKAKAKERIAMAGALDLADAAALSWSYDVTPRTIFENPHHQSIWDAGQERLRAAEREYDVFDAMERW